jgi:AcrR family transcriptional regulator
MFTQTPSRPAPAASSSPQEGRSASPRGQLARQALIEAGVEVFGANSLESATTRDIAQRAGQNIAAIAYYFGGKDGLYMAVVEHIASIIGERIGPLMDEIARYLAQPNRSAGRCLDYMGQLLASTIATHSDMLAVTSIIVKEQMHPTPAFDVLYARGLGQLQATGAALLEAYCGTPADAEETIVRFHALLGQSLAFRFARETIIRRAEWQGIGQQEEQLIRDVVVEQAQAVMRDLRRRFQKKQLPKKHSLKHHKETP